MADKTKEYISIITDCAKGFEEVFLDKNYLIIYKDDTNAYRSVETIAYKSNYLHLTGVKTKLSKNEFFDKAISSRLSESEIFIDKQSNVDKKMKVLGNAVSFPYTAKMTGYFFPRFAKNLNTEILLGNERFALGFVKDKNTAYKYYVPNTLLDGNIKDHIGKAYPIDAVFVKNTKENNYLTLVHLSVRCKEKGLLSFPLSKQIKKQIAPYIEQEQNTTVYNSIQEEVACSEVDTIEIEIKKWVFDYTGRTIHA